MNIQAVFFTDIERELTNGFEKRLAFDVANGSPNFSDDNVNIFVSQPIQAALDFVGDVRNDLNRFAQELAAALLFDHR